MTNQTVHSHDKQLRASSLMMNPPLYLTSTLTSATILASSIETKPGNKASGSARLIGSGTAGILELLIFHPVDTIAKRLMTNKQSWKTEDPTKSKLSRLNTVIFTPKYADRGHTELTTDTHISTHTTPTTPPLLLRTNTLYNVCDPLSVSLYICVIYLLFALCLTGVIAKGFSLFPGLGFAAVYKVSQRIYKFGGQPYVNDFLQRTIGPAAVSYMGKDRSKTIIHATAGSLIGVGEIILLPFDNLKIKAQTNPAALQELKQISARQIPKTIQALYAGAGFTALRNAPGSFALFGGAALTYTYLYKLQDYRQATFAQNFVGSIAGATCSILISSPFDVIKTRIQQQAFHSPTAVNGRQVFWALMKNEGVGALFKGLGPKLLAIGPKLVFSFTVAQYVIAQLETRFAAQA